jgi:hypothetical protein
MTNGATPDARPRAGNDVAGPALRAINYSLRCVPNGRHEPAGAVPSGSGIIRR